VLTLWGPCECGKDPGETSSTVVNGFTYITAKCPDCGKSFGDVYKVEYKGRFYGDEKKSTKLKRIK